MSMKTHLALYVNQYPEKIAALLQGHGFACQPVGRWASELAHQVQMRLSPRLADEVYQTASITLPGFPLEAAQALMPKSLIIEQEEPGARASTTWRDARP